MDMQIFGFADIFPAENFEASNLGSSMNNKFADVL
jgi:hypothetical protein